jgi:hypothetical protein
MESAKEETPMRIVSRALVILGLLVGSASCAMADVIWTFNNVQFSNGNVVTGYFITNSAGTMDLGYSIVVSGLDGQQAFTATKFVDSYLPSEIGFAGSSWFQFVDLSLTSPLTSAGGVIPIGGGYDCDGDPCWVLLVGGGHNPEVIGTPVPESSALLNLDLVSSLGLLGFLSLRRKISHA